MKNSMIIWFFGLFLLLGALLAPRAQAMVMIKNYSRYNAGYIDTAYSQRRNDAVEQKTETEAVSFWKNLLSIFR